MNGDIQESSVLLHVRLRSALDWFRELGLVEDPERAVTFGDEQSSVRKECQTKRRVDITRQHLQFERLLLRCDDLPIRVGDIGRPRLQTRRCCSDVGDELEDLLIGQLLGRETNHPLFRHAMPDRVRDFVIVGPVEPLLIEKPRRTPGQFRCAVASGTRRGEECRSGVPSATAAPAARRLSRSWSSSGGRGTRGCLLGALAGRRLIGGNQEQLRP